MRTLIVGNGEVGEALGKVLAEHKPEFIDPGKGLLSSAITSDYMHICIPYSDTFVETVERYKLEHQPTHLVVHSSVPVGT